MVNRSLSLSAVLFATCLVSLLMAEAVHAATARLSASQIYQYETVQLELVGSEESSPDLSALEQDFEVQGSSSQRSLQIVGGQLQMSEFILTLTLRPKRTGLLTIPAIALGNESTNALTLDVLPIDTGLKREIDRTAFFEIEVSNETPYQGQAVFLTRRLFYQRNVQIYGSLPGIPEIAGASVQPAGEASASASVIDGRRYNVYVSEYVLFADAPGQLRIPPVEVMARLEVPLGASRRALGLPIRSNETLLNVLPPPPEYPANKPWLPATSLAIESGFNVNQGQTGTPLTFDVVIRVEDALASQVAPLDLAFPSSIKAYPESPRLTDTIGRSEVRGERIERYSLVPTAPGIFTLPEVRLTWWNTQTGRMAESTLAAREIEILPDPNAPLRTPQSSIGAVAASEVALGEGITGTGIDWLHMTLALISALLGIGWLATSRPTLLENPGRERSRTDTTPEARAFDQLTATQALPDACVALREWLRLVVAEHPARARCEALLTRGEASLYADSHADSQSSTSPGAGELHKAARELRKAWLREKKHTRANGLRGLYAVRSPSSP